MIAFYLRLSIADGDLGKDDKEESNSIENQRLLLQSFVEARDDVQGEIVEYIDDGYSGTNFDRPSFKRMIEDAKKGKIHTIIVKDLSRLGRDYIGVGDYLEQIFPVLGIRFIAINSLYDSKDYIGKTVGLDITINNLVNALYSKDLSKKQKSALQTKWKLGKSTAGRVPFGYRKVEGSTHEWELDPEAAAYVRMIFDKALLGWGATRIAEFLNDNHIPTPGRYREEHSKSFQVRRLVNDEEWLWDGATVWRTIRHYAYTGALVHGTVTLLSVGSKKTRSVPKENQVIVDGVHPAIVTIEEWKEAQYAIKRNNRKAMPQKRGFPLTGKIRCGTCGLCMTYNDGSTPRVWCRHSRMAGKESKCDRTTYEARTIEDIVGFTLRSKLALFQALNTTLREEEKKGETPQDSSCRQLDVALKTLKARRIHLYESYAEGLLPKDIYLQKKEALNEEIERLQQEKGAAMTAISKKAELLSRVGEIAEQSAEILENRKLTKEIVDAFIERVVIFDPKHIEIIFTFEELLREAEERIAELQSEKGKMVSSA